VIAICNANLHGDTLWSVAAARALAQRAGTQADFFITWRAEQLGNLLRAQSFVRHVVIVHDRSIGFALAGEAKGYDEVYDLHMRGHEGNLLDWFCKVADVGPQCHRFDIPPDVPISTLPDGPFVAMAGKAWDQGMEGVTAPMREFTKLCPVPVVEVGFPTGAMVAPGTSIDRRSWGFLEMAGIISKCRVFLGTLSAPLVLADAFPDVYRVAVHDNARWDMRWPTRSDKNHYVGNPSGHDLIDLMKNWW